jgi:hypothetical protein
MLSVVFAVLAMVAATLWAGGQIVLAVLVLLLAVPALVLRLVIATRRGRSRGRAIKEGRL